MRNLRPFQIDESIKWRIGIPVAEDQAEAILLFGGDGTVHRYLTEIVSLGLPLLVVPAGSGNDFARGLGLHSVRDSLTAWRRLCAGEGNLFTIDLGVLTSLEVADGAYAPQGCAHYFCTVAGIGLDSEVSRRANALPRWLRGHGGYALSLAPTIFHFAPFPVKISAPDQSGEWAMRSDQHMLLVAFANSPTYGGGMKIAPRARMDDGRLDVCVIGGINPFKLACMFPTVYFGRHQHIRGVEGFQATRLRVETETPVDVYADGEFVCRTPVEVSVQRAALRVVTS